MIINMIERSVVGMGYLPGISDEDCYKILMLLCSICKLNIEIQELKIRALGRMCEDEKDNDV